MHQSSAPARIFPFGWLFRAFPSRSGEPVNAEGLDSVNTRGILSAETFLGL